MELTDWLRLAVKESSEFNPPKINAQSVDMGVIDSRNLSAATEKLSRVMDPIEC